MSKELMDALEAVAEMFGHALEVRLKDNAHKGLSWRCMTPDDLLEMAEDNLTELEIALHNGSPTQEVCTAAVDTAALLMMIVDLKCRHAVDLVNAAQTAKEREGQIDG